MKSRVWSTLQRASLGIWTNRSRRCVHFAKLCRIGFYFAQFGSCMTSKTWPKDWKSSQPQNCTRKFAALLSCSSAGCALVERWTKVQHCGAFRGPLERYREPYPSRWLASQTAGCDQEGDIETIGRYNLGIQNMTAHPKVETETGEVFAFQCFPVHPYLTLFRFQGSDALVSNKQMVPIYSLTTPSYIHDFAITKNYAVFPDNQLILGLQTEFEPFKFLGFFM